VKTHDALRDLVLSYEELDPGERAEADGHLAGCPHCRALLERAREAERGLRRFGELPPLDRPADGGAAAPDAATREEAEASLRALRTRLGLPPGPERPAAPRPALFRRWMTPAWIVPAAALAAALVLIARMPERGSPGIRDLAIAPLSVERGAGPSTTAVGGTWRTGQAFALRFALAAPAHPVVFHVDPERAVTLLHPGDAEAPVPRMPAGVTMQLPAAGSDDLWTFAGRPGPETFLVVAAPRGDLDLGSITAGVERIARRAGSRGAAVDAIESHLLETVGPVAAIEVTHAP
jgi:hypothetical protein